MTKEQPIRSSLLRKGLATLVLIAMPVVAFGAEHKTPYTSVKNGISEIGNTTYKVQQMPLGDNRYAVIRQIDPAKEAVFIGDQQAENYLHFAMIPEAGRKERKNLTDGTINFEGKTYVPIKQDENEILLKTEAQYKDTLTSCGKTTEVSVPGLKYSDVGGSRVFRVKTSETTETLPLLLVQEPQLYAERTSGDTTGTLRLESKGIYLPTEARIITIEELQKVKTEKAAEEAKAQAQKEKDIKEAENIPEGTLVK